MNKVLIYISLLIFMSSCDIENNSQLKIPEITPENFTQQNYPLSHFCDDIVYIPLDSQKFIQRTLSVQSMDSLFFISTAPDGLLVFNSSGKFIRQIGKRGPGPGEYMFGMDFTLDKQNQLIYINDLSKFIVYNFKGKLIREIKNKDEIFSKLYYTDNKLYGFIPFNAKVPNSVNWIVYDTIGKYLTRKRITVSSYSKSSLNSSMNCTYCFDNKIHYWSLYNDTIFELSPTTYKAKYFFKKDKNRVNPKYVETHQNIGNNKFFIPYEILESKNYLFINYRQFKKNHFCVYDKLNNNYLSNPYSENKIKGVLNDIDGGIAFNPYNTTFYLDFKNEEYLTNVVSAIDLIDHINSDHFKNIDIKNPQKKKALIKLANRLNENDNDNPVLMLMKLKQ